MQTALNREQLIEERTQQEHEKHGGNPASFILQGQEVWVKGL